MKKTSKLINKAGFSMIEIVIVIVVIALAVLPIMFSFSSFHTDTRATFEEVQATGFASEILGAFKSLPFKQLRPISMSEFILSPQGSLTSSSFGDPFSLATNAGNLVNNFGTNRLSSKFKIFLEVSSFPISGRAFRNTDMAKIIVKIKWGSLAKETKLITFRGR